MSVFRKKSLDQINSPEQLDDYIRVTTPSVWIVLLALVVLLVGVLAWSILGTIEVHDDNGNVEEGRIQYPSDRLLKAIGHIIYPVEKILDKINNKQRFLKVQLD